MFILTFFLIIIINAFVVSMNITHIIIVFLINILNIVDYTNYELKNLNATQIFENNGYCNKFV
jgi:hypothetical protein